MDGPTFDRLTCTLSAARSRRRLLGLVASLGLGGMLTRLDQTATKASAATTTATARRGGVRTQVDDAATEPSEEIDERLIRLCMVVDEFCNEVLPCCSPAQCVAPGGSSPRCCLPPGVVCNGDATRCCSSTCNGVCY